MKKTICWLLLAALLLVGCKGQAPIQEKQETVEMPLQSAPVQNKTNQGNSDSESSTAAWDESMGEIPPIEGYTDFASVLSAALIDGTGNKNLSPISVYLALAMAAEGAKGDTRAELLRLLGEEKLEDLRHSAQSMLKSLIMNGTSGELTLANAIFLGRQDGSVTFHEAYLDAVKKYYDAEADAVFFGEPEAGKRIVAWIREKTREKIQPSEDAMTFDADTLAVLLNTIYLKDSWKIPFDQDYTEQGPFVGLNGQELLVRYMRRTDTGAAIVRGEGYLRYAMGLSEVGRMVFVLPDEGVSLSSLLGSPEKIRELLYGGESMQADVNLMVPRFAFNDRTDLEETLMNLGAKLCLTSGADFSGMTDTPAHISRVLQESRIGVDESGVEAAAYTMVVMTKNGMSMDKREKVDFHLTRPFLYFIESQDGTLLFIGTVTAPDETK